MVHPTLPGHAAGTYNGNIEQSATLAQQASGPYNGQAMKGLFLLHRAPAPPLRLASRMDGGCLALAVVACLLASCVPLPPPLPAPPIFNFHELDPGWAYRSGQPDAIGLTLAIAEYNIRTVINLRGADPGEPWYDAEKAVCDAMGVALTSHAMDGGALPSGETLRAVVETLQTAPRPILIHCQMGADRTGAISAIYRMLILGQPRAEALAELSPVYFHHREDTPCMDKLAETYEPGAEWLAWYAENVGTISCVP